LRHAGLGKVVDTVAHLVSDPGLVREALDELLTKGLHGRVQAFGVVFAYL
jgi:hypothetical protein